MINHSQFPLKCSQHSQSEILGVCLESECNRVVKLFCGNCLLDDQHSKCNKQKKFTLDQLWIQIGNLKLSDSKSTQIAKQWLQLKQEILSLVEQLDQLMIKVRDYLDQGQNQIEHLRQKYLNPASKNLNTSEYHELCSLVKKQCSVDNQIIRLRPSSNSDQYTELLGSMNQYSPQIQEPLKKLKEQLRRFCYIEQNFNLVPAPMIMEDAIPNLHFNFIGALLKILFKTDQYVLDDIKEYISKFTPDQIVCQIMELHPKLTNQTIKEGVNNLMLVLIKDKVDIMYGLNRLLKEDDYIQHIKPIIEVTQWAKYK